MPNTHLEVKKARDVAAVKGLYFGLFNSAADDIAFKLEPALVKIAADPGIALPGEGQVIIDNGKIQIGLDIMKNLTGLRGLQKPERHKNSKEKG